MSGSGETGTLTLQPEAKPEERRSLAVYVSGLLDEQGGDAGGGCTSGWGAVCRHRFEFFLAHRMRSHKIRVDQVIAPEAVQEGKGQGSDAAGKRLQYLLEHRDHVVTKDELCAQVWPGQFISDATLEGCITLARRAIILGTYRPEDMLRQGHPFRRLARGKSLAGGAILTGKADQAVEHPE